MDKGTSSVPALGIAQQSVVRVATLTFLAAQNVIEKLLNAQTTTSCMKCEQRLKKQ
jgi:hypothetical protein